MRATLACFLLLILCLSAFGQSNYASVTGTVRDAQTLPVARATVHFKALSTGAVRVVVTDERGLFSAAALSPDDYELTAQAQELKMGYE